MWKGKDEQDSHDLDVPAGPVYIGEMIDPLALIEELRAQSEDSQMATKALPRDVEVGDTPRQTSGWLDRFVGKRWSIKSPPPRPS